MATVTFIQDYRGVLTNEQYYTIGQTAEIDDGTANELAERGIVTIATPPEPELKPKTTKRSKK